MTEQRADDKAMDEDRTSGTMTKQWTMTEQRDDDRTAEQRDDDKAVDDDRTAGQ